MSKIILGFDAGVNGGMAIIYPDGQAFANPFQSVDEYRDIVIDILRYANSEKMQIKAYVEELTGVVAGSLITPPASFKLGRNLGQIQGILIGLKIPHELVCARTWQKGLNGVAKLQGTAKKRKLKEIASSMFPDARITLKTADALLIANYGLKQNL